MLLNCDKTFPSQESKNASALIETSEMFCFEKCFYNAYSKRIWQKLPWMYLIQRILQLTLFD